MLGVIAAFLLFFIKIGAVKYGFGKFDLENWYW